MLSPKSLIHRPKALDTHRTHHQTAGVNTELSIEIDSLGKRYGDFCAISSLSLDVARGEVFGFLGPNGAGKTTTIRILMGMLAPSSGCARIEGLDCLSDRAELKRHVGYLPDSPVFYDYLRSSELLDFVGQMHGIPRAELVRRSERLLHELELADAADDFVVNYSLGMKKKMALALALVHEPRVLILDEPTTGLDPVASRTLRLSIQRWAEQGRTIFLSTHLVDMAESRSARGAHRASGACHWQAGVTRGRVRHHDRVGLEPRNGDLYMKDSKRVGAIEIVAERS
jgi:ABC-2 type transport system ATP-binding protein